MTDAEHEEFAQAWKEGRILLGIERAYARDIYLRLPSSEMQSITGETPYFEKFVVWCAFMGTFLFLVVSIVLLVPAVGLWAIILIPAITISWFVNLSLSVRANSSIVLLSGLLVVAALTHFSNYFQRPWLTGCVLALILSLWCGRLLYCSSTAFLRSFVVRNKLAHAAFAAGLRVRQYEGT